MNLNLEGAITVTLSFCGSSPLKTEGIWIVLSVFLKKEYLPN